MRNYWLATKRVFKVEFLALVTAPVSIVPNLPHTTALYYAGDILEVDRIFWVGGGVATFETDRHDHGYTVRLEQIPLSSFKILP